MVGRLITAFDAPDDLGFRVGSTWTIGCAICFNVTFDYGLPGDIPLLWRSTPPPP